MAGPPTDDTSEADYHSFHIPIQKRFANLSVSNMKASVSTYPPLGQATQIDTSTKLFTALLAVDESRANEQWQVSLWHTEGGEWKESTLVEQVEASGHPTHLQKISNEGLKYLYFTAPLSITQPTTFTVKFRNGSDQSWKWVKDYQGAQDGVVYLKMVTSQNTISSSLEQYIEGLNPALSYKNHRSQSPGTSLWSVETLIEAAGEKSTLKDVKLGLPWGIGKFSRWFIVGRIWSPWLAPYHGKTRFQPPREAILCSFLSHEGKHLVLLAISGVDNVMTLFTSDDDGNVVMRIRNDSSSEQKGKVLVGLGDDFESANAAVMYHARDVITATQTASGEAQKELHALKDGDSATKMWAENWYDGLTYCTWNALGQRLTEEKIINAVELLAKNKINITNFIIDDNWQSIDYEGPGQFQYGWVEFEAERKAFPNGLKHTIDLIRQKQPSIQHVAVWHAILGYWGGLAPGGKIAKSYKTVEVTREDSERRNLPLGGKMTVVAKEDVQKFYNDFYQFLTSCGVDGVKTDAQFMLDTFMYPQDRRDLIYAYQEAWTISHLRHFSIKAISCMSQTPDILFHSQLPQNKPSILVRNSDDFFPAIPSSHPWHIFANAHNALFTQHLNVIPDWDMFQTVHDYSGFHAAARCVSGGPIYITDVPGEHNIDLINQMTGPSPRGKTVIFRPSVIGRTLDQYNEYNDENLLLVGTYHGVAVTGTGIIGIFNISTRPLSQLIPLSKFPGVIEAQYYIIRAHSSGFISQPLQVVDSHSLVYISLDVRGYDILSSYPLRGFVIKDEETIWLANLGLLGKMTGAAAVVSCTMQMLENGRILVENSVKALGVLGLYISNLPKISFKDSMMITILGKVIPLHTVKVSKVDEHVLEIDIETAWKELELDSGWSNEVEVKISIIPSK